MTISYNWLSEYLPKKIEPSQLSDLLTSIGLEVESLEKYEEVKGGLAGLIAGEVMTCEKHPEADKLKLTTVNIGSDTLLNIVCGAPNVAIGQKVIVATVGCTIYPNSGDAITLKKAKIRGAESQGMICAEDEIGLGESHEGIKILPDHIVPGTPLTEIFQPYQDYILEIGLTPNRMDAMSHLGVAKDICAYLSYHEQTHYEVRYPYPVYSATKASVSDYSIVIENKEACMRYCGVLVNNISVSDSPLWLKQRIKSIGLKPINNLVDITNFILHETGQPLHAFDASKIEGNTIIVKTAPNGTVFTTLDDKERILSSTDLMIYNQSSPMCMAGVYGGLNSGITASTNTVFIESAWFHPSFIRRTSIVHGLRTDAATRFEKGVDISNTMQVLKRAAKMVTEVCGGEIASDFIEQYPEKKEKTAILFELDYLKKISGKSYPAKDVKIILSALGFEILKENDQALELLVPFSKTDIHIPADIVEEIMRIDGLDHIEIPENITIAPSSDSTNNKFALKEKIANQMVGLGFHEMFTNSISNSAFHDESTLSTTVSMMNSLSSELNILRPTMIHSGLQVIAHNLNRKNLDLRFFEFGKSYHKSENLNYSEKNHLSLFVSGNIQQQGWNSAAKKSDYFYLKGILENMLIVIGFNNVTFKPTESNNFNIGSDIYLGNIKIGELGEVSSVLLKKFDVKQAVFFADVDFDAILQRTTKPILYREISKFPSVNRDLALVVDKNVSYSQIERIALSAKIPQLITVELFDIFESEKLGVGKKSMAVSFTFLDENKTLTDQEIDSCMKKLILNYEKEIQAEIRKQ